MPAAVLYVAEPAPQRANRPAVVVDCSVVSAVLWAEPMANEALVRMAGCSLHAPDLLRHELANVARTKARNGVPPSVARAGLETFAELQLALRAIDMQLAFDIAQLWSLTAYDAAYLCLAAELRAPLLTFDRRLGEAAVRHLNPPR